ncbi:hypothetical protein B1748_05875 [Paenibacillus sp. MY03]|jgi:uncharacterized protein YpmB|uniref:DUF5590 domain-containing protein n=2 Tax=Paenibacillus TaxID=44249 RepID=A0A2R5F2Y3_9BACL|nr:hypothetical protein B1748_05875 [Paenibacillus sp. MY03]GBG11988.1 hypothetical protein PAT3040_06848 [Paenibacillus agaridevorans]
MRATERKRRPFMTPAKWIWMVSAALLTFLIWLGLYYRDIQLPHWSAEAEAKQRIVATGEISNVERLNKHIWDETVWVGFGAGEQDDYHYVFLRSDETTLTVDASDVLGEDELKAQFRSSKPGTNIVRVQAGLFRGAPAWEIYYSAASDGGVQYFYDFYTFDKDGKLIDSYRLPSS